MFLHNARTTLTPKYQLPYMVKGGTGRTQSASRAMPEMPELWGIHQVKKRGGKNSIKRKQNPPSPRGRSFVRHCTASPGSELGQRMTFSFNGCISHSFCPFLKFLLPANQCHSCFLRAESQQVPSHPAPCSGLAWGKRGDGSVWSVFLSIVYSLLLLSTCVFLFQPTHMHS